MTKRGRSGGGIALVLAVTVAWLSGCGTTEQTRIADTIETATLTDRELRMRVNEFSLRFTTLIEQASSEIFFASNDYRVRRRTIGWAVRANEECLRTTYHRDAVISLLDVWSLCGQMLEFLETGDGSEWFGEHQALAVDVVRQLESEIADIAANFAGPEVREDGRRLVQEWVEEFPLEGDNMARVSSSIAWTALGQDAGRGIAGVAADVAVSLEDLNRRLEDLNSQLPKQISWHVALLVNAWLGPLDGSYVRSTLDELSAELEGVPDQIAEQGTVVLGEVDRLRVESLDEIDRQRSETLDRAEKIANTAVDTLDRNWSQTLLGVQETIEALGSGVDQLRTDTTAQIEDTLGQILKNVDGQRTDTLDRIDALVAAAVEEASTTGDAIVNAAFLRGFLLLLVALVGAGLLIILARKTRPQST